MRISRIWLVMVSVGVSGCQLLGWGGFGGNDDHRDEWESRTDGTYQFVMNRSCFCIPAGEFDVRVVDYQIKSMVRSLSGESVDAEHFGHVHTIEQLFDLIDEARRGNAHRLEVEYEREGYPSVVNIDWYEQIADDEIYYAVSDVEY